MLNILTTGYKELIRTEYRKRKMVVSLTVIFILLSIGLLLSFSLYVVSTFKTSVVSVSDNKILVGDDLAEFTRLKQSLVKLNSDSEIVASSSPIKSSGLLEKIIEARTLGIKIESFSVDFLDGKKLPVGSISGSSASRQSLINFAEALKKDKAFTKVDYPVANLISEGENRFIISLEIAKK